MRLRDFVPEGLKSYVRLIAARLRHPDSYIATPLVASGATLGNACSVSRGAEVSKGVAIGDYSYVNCGAIIASGRIGKFCSIGPYSLVGMPEHPTAFLSTSPRLYGQLNVFNASSEWNDFPSPPEIGNDVWIGAHAFIRQGVRIGHGAIVGTGAVVTHDVPPYAIVAGVPAKLIRYRFDADTIESLLALRWWERGVDELASLRPSFHGPVEALPEVVCR